MIEVEVKAWVEDPAALERVLSARFPFVGTFRKEDVYFRLPGASSEFRLRRAEGESVVTAKEKSIDSGVEVNVETEFTVSDAEAFERFARAIGAEPFVRKTKVGRAYGAEAVRIELSEVARLGTFIEIEKLIDEGRAAEASAARSELLDLLASLGVGLEKVERRYYIDMLMERDRRG